MPLLDMPLEQLKQYRGTNPKPSDFDEYWERALAELASVDKQVLLEPFDFPSAHSDSFEMTFTSTKGARIYARLMKPKNIQGKVPAVLCFHGLGGDFDDWVFLNSYASQGYVVAALDCRGQGGRSQDVGGIHGTTYSTPFIRGLDGHPDDLYVRDLFLDTAAFAQIVMDFDFVDETRVGVLGISQGGGLSVACAALVPQIKLCAPNYPYMSDYLRVWEMDLDKRAYEGLQYYLRQFDPRHERIAEIFTKLGYIDIQHLAPRIRANVLMATGLMDDVCPPSTQFAAYNKMNTQKKVVIYPDFGHEDLKGHDEIVFRFFAENL